MKGKYEATVQKKNSKKGVALLLVLFLLVGCVIGTTLAWLTAATVPIINTFTVGDVGLSLTETNRVYKMTPGAVLDKDPTVTVAAGSESSYVFVKVVEANDTKGLLDWSVDSSVWTKLDGVDDVWYKLVPYSAEATPLNVLTNKQVTVSNGMLQTDVAALKANAPTLTITAYAIQSEGYTDQNADTKVDALDAWKLGGWAPQIP